MLQDKITIYGPKDDGSYVVEFKSVEGEALAISVSGGESAVLKHFQSKIPYGLVVADVLQTGTADARVLFPRFRRRGIA